jgi:hypothetical protein
MVNRCDLKPGNRDMEGPGAEGGVLRGGSEVMVAPDVWCSRDEVAPIHRQHHPRDKCRQR